MSWAVRVREKARKTLSRFPRKDQEQILASLSELSSNPYSGDLQKLEGEDNAWRRRVGNYRISYEVIPKDRVVYVFRIERRTSKSY